VTIKALAGGCGTWEGIRLLHETARPEKPQHKCEKGKEGAKNAKGREGHHTCMKEKCQGCASIENVTLGFGDLEKYHGHLCRGWLSVTATQVALTQLYPGEIPPRGDQFV